MDRDTMFGLTEEDYGYDDDDEAFEQYGLFTSAGMFSGSGYRGYSGADIVTKPSMAAAQQMSEQGSAQAGSQEAVSGSAGFVSPDMALEQAVMALEEESLMSEELKGAKLVAVGDDPSQGLAGFGASSRDAQGFSEEDYWGDEDEQALLYGFGEF
ncbi:MAG: hypothetical protein Q4F23_02595 [Coriobacteriia bacterium]|nr:hypothetical protein [Coriobacteriia bacterium]